MTRQSVVEIRNVSRSFRSPEGALIRAVDDISLNIEAGKFTTLLGPSGCGKTTLLRMIAGFEEPDQGTVFIDGSNMTFHPPYERPVNTVFQHYALFPHMTVAENIGYGLSVAGVAKGEISRRVSESLQLVRLDGMGSRPTRKLSGGQQQRVALARALILQPKILLLDEPLAALDRRLRKDMQFELKKLQHELGVAFLCVTHDQEEALAMSDQIVVMNSGHVEQIGTPKEIYQTPKTRFAAGFIGEMNFIKATAAGSGTSTTSYEGNGGLKVSSTIPSAPGTSVTLAIRPEHFRIGTGAPTQSSAIVGTVIDSSYLGTNTRIELDASGNTLHVETEGAAVVGNAGDHISLEYDPTRVLVLPA